ncbi:transcription factor GATA-4 [Triticum aestivum]|uniref:transcription factor GATA-4 n=1 Tax=Triticum aestivum TaxID=4565 RepID=UPI001D02994D|nr:transcription factor GATA-4-like [Triticum aestivum]
MADKGKGKAVEDTAGTSSQTSGRTETAGGGGTQQELPLGASSQISGAPGGGGGSGLSQTLSNQARGSAPFGGQNQIANPQFAGGGCGGGSGAGFRGFSQFADGHGGFSQFHSSPPAAMVQPTLGSQVAASGSAPLGIHPASGQNGNRCQTMPPVGDQASVERDCTICEVATPRLWIMEGTPLPLCEDCERKIFFHARPLQHLEQYLASTAVGGGAGSIPVFLAAHGRVGWFSQWAGDNPSFFLMKTHS